MWICEYDVYVTGICFKISMHKSEEPCWEILLRDPFSLWAEYCLLLATRITKLQELGDFAKHKVSYQEVWNYE